jgi:antitoxin VapB
VRPGQAEQEIAACLGDETQRRGAQPIVNLIAVDERVVKYRHPLPTDKTLERYALLVLCGRWRGLVCSISRLVHFGPLPDALRRKAEAVAAVDAAYHAATRPGATLGEIIQRGQRVYAETGFAEEWRFHHQGGAAGYEPREVLGTPDSKDVVAVGQAFAWNPSIAGTKSEDTLLVGEQGSEVLTAIDDWPLLPNGRPAFLEVT